jgi:N-acetylglucosaminyldiphosphoundecaprenol N-acetyl-beta-D-mannosaminyltransferase
MTRILGMDIFNGSREDFYSRLDRSLKAKSAPILIATVNPEILLLAKRDPSYKKILDSADLRVCDGIGVKLAALLLGRELCRLTGREILNWLLDQAAKNKYRLLIVLKKSGLLNQETLNACLHGKYPELDFGVQTLSPSEKAGGSSAQIVITTFGAPEQEMWISANRDSFTNSSILIGVGGALDVLCGSLPNPPAKLSKFGLEWLWRVVIQPKRWRRIVNAVLVFPIVFTINVISNKLRYEKN